MKVVFSDLATKKAAEVSDYLAKEWSEKVKKISPKRYVRKLCKFLPFLKVA